METKAKKHSEYSASGAERWANCPGSVALSRGLPDKTSEAASEGTRAHALLEKILVSPFYNSVRPIITDMERHVLKAAQFILYTAQGHVLLVEEKISLAFIHPEAFGTTDAAIIDHFGTLHIIDFKYGFSPVSPKGNLQLIYYALGVAHKYDWNFNEARLWIIQPRVTGYDGPTFWDLSIKDLKSYVTKFKKAVERVEKFPNEYLEGDWCFFCRAKSICPLKQQAKTEKAISLFSATPYKRK